LRPDELRALLSRVRRGAVTPAAAARAIADAPLEQLGFATLDHQRALRTGVPEVVFGPGKSVPDLVAIVTRLYQRNGLVLATRVSPEGSAALLRAFPAARHYERCGAVVVRRHPPRPRGRVLVVCAGTSDLPVAEEAAVTAETLGSNVELIADVGVAGLHRLLAHREKLRGARAVVVVAGLEGALPSVVGGLVDRPVIAVPTSIGYGAHFGGLAPLLAMLNSCAPGVTVVNVNNGFGAGYAAHLMNVGARSAGEGKVPFGKKARPGTRRPFDTPAREAQRARKSRNEQDASPPREAPRAPETRHEQDAPAREARRARESRHEALSRRAPGGSRSALARSERSPRRSERAPRDATRGLAAPPDQASRRPSDRRRPRASRRRAKS